MLYIDEFQVYANPGFEDMLTQGRSYRVASHLATQTRALIGRGGKDGRDFLEVVSTNARNLVIYPGGSADDAKYYEALFGEEEEVRFQKGISQTKFSIWSLFSKFTPATESIRESKEMVARYSATDIMYQPFGRVFYRIIKNNSIQPPGISQIEYIPKELNDTLDRMVEEYNAAQLEEDTSSEIPMVSTTALDDSEHMEDVVDDDNDIVDPLVLIHEEESEQSSSNNKKQDKPDDYIFIDEGDKNKAKTQSDVIDLEEGDVIEL